ncbi:MAG: hypothetical protein J6N19_02125 [Clostridium sp.]|nr:hypothetical protein [Clostridium sp.]
MARKVNWEKIKTEYITGDISQRKLAEKYGVPYSTLRDRARKDTWFKQRKKSRQKVVSKSVQKVEAKQVRVATKELTLLDKIERHLDRAISDVDQFNRYIVTEQIGHGMTETSEQMYSKADMKALKDAMQVLAMVEKMKQERLDRANNASNEMRVKFVDGSDEEWGD